MTISLSKHCRTCVESMLDLYPGIKDKENYEHYTHLINSIIISPTKKDLSCLICGSHIRDEKQKTILQLFCKIMSDYHDILPIENGRIQLREEALQQLEPVLDFLKLNREKKEG